MRASTTWVLVPLLLMPLTGCGADNGSGCPSGDGLSIDPGENRTKDVDVLAGFVRQSNFVVNGHLYTLPQAPNTRRPGGTIGPAPDLPSDVLDGIYQATIALDDDRVTLTVAGKQFWLGEIVCD